MAPPPPPPPPPPPQRYDPNEMEANGRYQRKPQPTSVIVILNVVNTITQLLIGAVACCALSYANLFAVGSAFTQHIYLCVTGYIILMSQAILSFNTHAGWAYSLKYPEKKLIHSAMQVVGAILAIVGSIIIIVEMGGVNFQSAHAITGLIAMLLTFLSLGAGIMNFVFPAENKNPLYKTIHTGMGSLTMIFAFVCLCLAFTNWYRFQMGDINANVAIALSVFALAGILISAFSRTTQRIIIGM